MTNKPPTTGQPKATLLQIGDLRAAHTMLDNLGADIERKTRALEKLAAAGGSKPGVADGIARNRRVSMAMFEGVRQAIAALGAPCQCSRCIEQRGGGK